MRKVLSAAVALLFAFAIPAYPQGGPEALVMGVVVDRDSSPVPGATVMVKNSPALGGVVTDLEGNFSIKVPAGSVLVFSCIGFRQAEKTVTASDLSWIITLDDDSTLLEEVVVVGYGVQTKESVVGAISQVNASVLENSGTTSINNALSGKVPGLLSYSQSASGAPGENDESLLIRGLSSWNGSAPLVMVDGIERMMSELSPSEIESVSVLKDASATAVYGAKGANGVILVTTKTGKKGAPKFHVNAEYSMASPVMLPAHVDALTTATMANVAYRNQGSFASAYTDRELSAFASGSNPLRYPDTDFYSLLLKDFSPGMNADISLSGGTDRFKYYAYVGYVHEGSIIKDIHEYGQTNYSSDRINWRFNMDLNVTGTTTLSLKAGGNLKDIQGPVTGSSYSSPTSTRVVFGYMYKASTISYPAYYPASALVMYPDPDYPTDKGVRIGDNQGNYIPNPYSWFMNAAYIRTEENRINTDLILKQDLDFITKGLSASVKAGLTSSYGILKEDVYVSNPRWNISWTSVDAGLDNPWIRSVASQYVWNLKPYTVSSSNSATGVNFIFYLEGAVNYKRKFAKAHNVTGLLLYNQRQYNSAASFPKRNQSFVGRVTYDYKGRYLLEVNAGVTGSEQFAPANRYGFFPSVAVGYNVSKENWWKKAMPWWSTLKLRYSHGKVGSDNTTANWLYYTYWSKVSASSGVYYTEGAVANENARWETAVKRDIGLEMGWLDDDISLNVDFYNEDRKDILVTPIITMFVSNDYKDINAGAMKKHGIEIDLGYRHVFPSSFAFETGVMVGLSENRITSYEDLPYAPEYQKYAGTQYGVMRTGNSLVDDKYFNTVDEIHGYPVYTSTWSTNVVPGVYKFLDFDNNGVINQNDLHAIRGSVYAPGVYSLRFGFGYKGLSFSMLGTGTVGKYITYNGEAMVPFALGELVVHKAQTDYWTPTNHDATAPVPLFSQLMYSWGGGDLESSGGGAVNVDGYSLGLEGYTWRRSDYFMLKEARLSYKFDFTRSRHPVVKGLTLSLSGNNLLLFSPIPDMNPTATSGTNAAYPQMRTVKLGLSMDF